MAIAGMGDQLRGFARSMSRATMISSSSYGSMKPSPSIFGKHLGLPTSPLTSAITPPSLTNSVPLSSSRHAVSDEAPLLDEIPPELLESSYTPSLALAVIVAVLASFQNGYNSGVLNVPEAVIRQSLALTDLQWSIAVAIFCVGGLTGSSIGGQWADRYGRKQFLVTNNVFFIAGALLQALATNFWFMTIGRFLVGMGCGGATVVVPLYLGEIAPANLRGSLGTMNQFACVVGILVANLLGKPFGTAGEWRYLLGFVLVPSLIQIIFSRAMLESPLWLIIQGGSKNTMLAEEILSKLRGRDEVEFDIECMIHSAQENSNSDVKASKLQLMLTPAYRLPLAIGFLLQITQQFSGINAVFYYSTSFFQSAHVNDPWMGSVLASSVNVLATALALHLMDRTGRKTLILVSAIGMMISCVGITGALLLQQSYQAVWIGYVSVLWVLLFVTFFEIGLGPIPWLIGAEIYPSSIRAPAMSVSSVINWISNFIVSLTFPHINAALQEYCFAPFGVVLFCSVLFTIYYVPETRGKSLEEIQEELTGINETDGENSHRFPFDIEEEEGENDIDEM